MKFVSKPRQIQHVLMDQWYECDFCGWTDKYAHTIREHMLQTHTWDNENMGAVHFSDEEHFKRLNNCDPNTRYILQWVGPGWYFINYQESDPEELDSALVIPLNTHINDLQHQITSLQGQVADLVKLL